MQSRWKVPGASPVSATGVTCDPGNLPSLGIRFPACKNYVQGPIHKPFKLQCV